MLLLQGGDYTYHLLSQQHHREGILAVYYQLLLKPIYTMTKRVLFLNLMNIEGYVVATGQKLGAALDSVATLSLPSSASSICRSSSMINLASAAAADTGAGG